MRKNKMQIIQKSQFGLSRRATIYKNKQRYRTNVDDKHRYIASDSLSYIETDVPISI